MKAKKLIVFISILAAIIFVGIFTNNVKAAGPGYLTIIKERTVHFQTTDVTYKHQIYKGTTDKTENIWNIVTCTTDGVVTDTIPDLYCLRAGLGFTTQNQEESRVDSLTSPFQRVEYTQDLDMVTGYNSLQSQLENSSTTIFKEGEETYYYELLWVLDHMLLENATEDELIQYLKEYAEYPEEDFTRENAVGGEFLTRADIEAIQQLAIWYFTNHDDDIHNTKELTTIFVDISNKKTYLGDSKGEYKSYADLFNTLGGKGTKRQDAAEALYKNLIEKAETAVRENGNTYTPLRELTVYLAGTSAAQQQPVVRIKETNKEVDLALRKFISAVNGTPNTTREPEVNTKILNKEAQVGTENKYQTTAEYNHTKEPLKVQIGDIVTYTLRIYNEGELPAYVTQVTDYLPTYLDYIKYGKDTDGAFWALNDTARVATTTSECEIVGASEDIAEKAVGKKLSEVLIPAAVKNVETDDYTLSYVDIQISCKVVSSIVYGTNITNIAQITEMKYQNGNVVESDRDSTPDGNFTLPTDPDLPTYKDNETDKSYVPGQEDDDDFEKVYVEAPALDLALRKFISQVGETKYNRAPQVISEGLKTGADTAIYNHSKEPVKVQIGDIVTYTIRVYNEGEIDAKVTEITDYLAPYLQYVAGGEDAEGTYWTFTTGEKYNTAVSTENCTVKGVGGNTDTKYVGDKLGSAIIPAYDAEHDTLSYVDVEIHCKVLPVTTETKVTNIAEITKETDKDGNQVGKEEDSTPNDVTKPEDFPGYKDDEQNKEYIPGQEDDDDFEKVLVVPKFDLALRKFITRVGTTNVNNRYPNVVYENGNLKYEHTKDALGVATGDTVIYTIRVYNEGEADGYAEEITDDVPEGLEFLPDNEINKEYRWVMLDENEEEVTDVSKAKYLITDYLSEEQGEASERDNLIKAFNKDAEIDDKNPDYRDVQIAFKVTYTATTKDETERTLVNVAQISKDSGDDEDSEPNRDEVYNKEENEDDIDYEQVKVKYFDLSLLKWVAQTKVTLNGKTTTTNTGHTAETSKNEAPVKIEIKASDVKKVKIQYVYTIRVTNEGEIEGYAKEVTDYIPKGLKFVKEDNPNWYEISDGVIGTKALENTLLKPGESAEVQVVLTWINGQENFGEKINLAEISKDENPSGSPDIDSTPNNKKPEEDDIDDAPVILAVKTGTTKIYAGLTMIILITLAGGISLIKKYVLE